MSIQELLLEGAQLIAIAVGLIYVLPQVKAWLIERRAQIISDELRTSILALVERGREEFNNNHEVYKWVRERVQEKYPEADIEEIEGHIVMVLDLLERNLDISNYITRR